MIKYEINIYMKSRVKFLIGIFDFNYCFVQKKVKYLGYILGISSKIW